MISELYYYAIVFGAWISALSINSGCALLLVTKPGASAQTEVTANGLVNAGVLLALICVFLLWVV
jgi:hypothetical protein